MSLDRGDDIFVKNADLNIYNSTLQFNLYHFKVMQL